MSCARIDRPGADRAARETVLPGMLFGSRRLAEAARLLAGRRGDTRHGGVRLPSANNLRVRTAHTALPAMAHSAHAPGDMSELIVVPGSYLQTRFVGQFN